MTDRVCELRIEPISKSYIRKFFKCDESSLNIYIQRHARQNDEKNIAKCFVVVDDKKKVLAYYTLSTSSIKFEELPEDYVQHLPHYPIPAVLIGQLAVDCSATGQGLGTRLLIDALQRVFTISEGMAIKVVLVDAINDKAKEFYLRFGFIDIPGDNLKLFLPIETISQLFD